MLLKIIYIIITLLIGALLVKYLCDVVKISTSFKSYFQSIKLLTKLSSNEISNSEDLQKKLNGVSLSGIRLLKYIAKFLIPFLITFFLLQIFLGIKFGITLLLIVSSFPYLILINKNHE